MSDIYTAWSPALSRGDWVLTGPVLQSGSDVVTAVLISLFTDRVANADDDIPDGSDDPRGWWGDAGQKYKIGSRLWLLDRVKQTDEVLKLARDYATEALQWLIDDGVVAKFTVLTEWTRGGMLGMQVVAYRQDGTTVALNFSSAWDFSSSSPSLVPPQPNPSPFGRIEIDFVVGTTTIA